MRLIKIIKFVNAAYRHFSLGLIWNNIYILLVKCHLFDAFLLFYGLLWISLRIINLALLSCRKIRGFCFRDFWNNLYLIIKEGFFWGLIEYLDWNLTKMGWVR